MGQYYVPTIIYPDGSAAVLNTYDYSSGMKLMEHSWIGNHLVNAVYAKIRTKPRRIAWIGDYSVDGYETCGEAYTMHFSLKEFLIYYKLAWPEEEEERDGVISPTMYTQRELRLINEKTKAKYLVNRDLKEYLDLGTYIARCTVKEGEDDWCVNPLPLLTACGNGRGGGDFRNSSAIGYEHVGIWAFHELELTTDIPKGYRECLYSFVEGRA